MKKVFFAAFMLLFFLNTNVFAEDCSATGACLGSVGYVFLSVDQYRTNTLSVRTLNGVQYKVDTSNVLFKEKGLPKIGAIVTLNNSFSELLLQYDFQEDLGIIKNALKNWKSEIYDEKTKTVTLEVLQFRTGDRMDEGTKVQVIGYRLLKEFIPEITDNHLMVLVQVISEPDFNQATNNDSSSSPSFDCKKAKSKSEKLICGSKELSEADALLNSTYKNVLAKVGDTAAIKKDQINWAKTVRDTCDDVASMLKAYEERIKLLNEMVQNGKN